MDVQTETGCTIQTETRGPSTLAVHGGGERHNPYHAVVPPIVQTATYAFRNTADLIAFQEARQWGEAHDRVDYGRYGNPTVAALEARVAALEGAEAAAAFSTGMAAITAILFAFLRSGAHLIVTEDAYRRTRQFILQFLRRFGVEATVVPIGDFEALESAIRPNTRLIFTETPTNPYLRVVDLERLAEVARRRRIRTVVDSTFATPVNLRPLDYGVDLVVHSATKYMCGHNDAMAGVVAGSAELIAGLREMQAMIGGILDPHAAYLVLRGLKTLALRVQRQNENGMRVAEFLSAHPKIRRVWYPGLPSHPDHAVARRLMRGFGGVVTFEVAADREGTSRFIDALRIPYIAPSLGGVESLVEQPALMSYYEMEPEDRMAIGITDSLVRLSLGIEDADDLLADLDRALAHV
ncbi:MAG: aminotransferase class I/II-fold pyridoxal phosphate-dependent enzyme [Thermoflexus sp.]|uniref:trans-sulfuration enzyme family protein n=1 Tax=Thermoflexus sp. TaxID=1969742 RepID=UPI0025DA06A9|nr:aminotransferase class I/II-fold pyridoxal phosphate-dependent enzyme [Thermoflexus sp.]MCS6964443.1 aminotransferase class I/II-fold pyridoxal phosphate-dependent enzyme [Thermoflexus sp.]MDW8184856.1 aminotransferase class I/II-fold pyridoxal phosphate-dependent enzyme [Anaerolineae bacterium]